MNPLVWFAAWRCECTDMQPNRDDIPDRCPCHDTDLLGVEQCTPGISADLGHMCPDSEGSRP